MSSPHQVEVFSAGIIHRGRLQLLAQAMGREDIKSTGSTAISGKLISDTFEFPTRGQARSFAKTVIQNDFGAVITDLSTQERVLP